MERKRLAFARPLPKKGLMMIDEGTSGLDNDTKNVLLDVIFASRKLSVLFITHDHDILHRFDKVLLLKGGTLKEFQH